MSHATQGPFLERDEQSAARASTGPNTAAATTQRVGGGDGKSGPVSGFNEINFDGSAPFQQIIVNQKLQAAILVHFVAILWLIQSQPKRWATSATLHQCDANCRTDVVLLQISFQIVDSKGCYFKHSASLKVKSSFCRSKGEML